MAHGLSTGALGIIMRGEDYNEPIVQVLSVKRMQSGSGNPDKDRYRAFLSDGQYSVSYAMMSAPIYAKTGENGLTKFTIMKIKRHMTSVINNTEGKDSRVLLILDLEVITPGEQVGEKIGNPVALDKAGIVAAAAASSTAEAKRPASSDLTSNSSTRSFYGEAAPPLKAQKTSENSVAGDGNVSLAGQITHPISSLSPYHNKWIIKARVTNKSDVRSWTNAKGSGQLFSFEVADESGEIRITGFKEAVEKFYDLIQIDKVYYISKCQLKTANKQFNSCKNDYEMTLSSETIIEECHDDDMSSLQTKYNFVEINKIADVENNQIVDVIGVAKTTSEIQTFQAKSTGRELRKREVHLVDQSNSSITLTLWGTQADNFDGSGNPIVCVKGAKVGEFGGGKNISAVSGSLIRTNPEIKECYRLKTWYETEGAHIETHDISAKTGGGYSTPWMCFKEVADQQIGSVNEKGDYYQVKATILLLRTENCLYKACAQPECNKKVVDGDGSYTCEKCGITSESFKYRLLCSMNVGDWSGNQWVSMFSDEGEKVVGMTAQQAGTLQSTDPLAFQEAMEKVHFKEFILKCRAKMEQYNDEQRIKTVAVRVDPVNYKEYNAYLISKIKQLTSCS